MFFLLKTQIIVFSLCTFRLTFLRLARIFLQKKKKKRKRKNNLYYGVRIELAKKSFVFNLEHFIIFSFF